jgi:uncharacterized protein (TIGR00730 family)
MKICSFVGSSEPEIPQLKQTLRTFATWVAQHNHTLVCGGMAFGGMKILGQGVLAAGGKVMAITPEEFAAYEAEHTPDHPMLQRVITPNLHQRLERMVLESDAFVAFPGGIGTMHEIMQVLADNQALTYHKNSARAIKPLIIYNHDGFFIGLKAMLAQGVLTNYIKPEHVELMTWVNTPPLLFAALHALP